MREIKKIMGLLVAAIMLFAMVIPAVHAADDGSITITNATPGQTYATYKIFDAQLEDTANGGGGIVYFASEAQKTWYEAQAANPFRFPAQNNAGSFYVEKKDEVTDQQVIEFLQSFINSEKVIDPGFAAQITQQGGEQKPAEGVDQVVFNNLPYGYYLITSSLGATVTVTSTNKDVEVKDKNQQPTWPDEPDPEKPGTAGKIIVNSDISNKVSTSDYGEEVQFKISVNATNYTGKKMITEYTIEDVIDAGFDYKLNSTAFEPVVKIGGNTLTQDTDYTLEWTPDTRTFKVVIPWIDAEKNFKYKNPSTITVEYSAILNEKAVIAGAGNKNTAKFSYKDEENEVHENPPEETVTYTYAIAVNKTDKTGAGLAGAEFTVSRNGVNLKFAEEAPGTGVYAVSTAEGASEKILSPDGGVILIKGLKKGTYQLIETVAPDGYNPLTGSAEITVGGENQSYSTSYTVYYDANGQVTQEVTEHQANVTVSAEAALLNIVNFAGTQLPSTGGMGTALFYLVGAALVAGALAILIFRRKKGRTE